MTARPELPRIPSIASLSYSFHTRRSSVASEDDVFGDEHALDSPVTIDNAPLGPVPAPRQQYFDDPFHDRNASSSSLARPYNNLTTLDRSSTSKQRLMIDDQPVLGRGLGRSISTSSRLTIPRAPSPYNGPTAPSRQYEMHSQLTRSASIASQSTFRPGPETPFVLPRRGPEHPYELYTQNVAPEEDEDITTNGIPVLGFPRNFQSSSRGGSSADTGDIVGNDGHIEQLPPYTRYADNTVAKGDMNGLSTRRSSRASRAPTTTTSAGASSSEAPLVSEADSTTPLRPREQFEEETAAQRARKEGWRGTWKERARNRTIAGMPLWGLITIVLIVIFSATIGGVVGGVIGNRQGAERAYANGAVTTIWLDAVPTTLGPHSSPLPTGHYQIPFNQSEEIKQCIPNDDIDAMGPAWGCMDIAYIGINVFQDPNTNAMMAAFEDFSVNTQDFRYGPQPPDFNGTAFSLSPMQDKDAGNLGVAMFFSVLFDKLTILPEYALNPDDFTKKRSVDEDVIARSIATYDGKPLKPADQPWFCFWNSTINEFFIYLNQDAPSWPNATSSTTNNKVIAHTTSAATKTSASYAMWTDVSAAAMVDSSTMATSPTPGPTIFAAYAPTPAAAPTNAPKKRSFDTSAADVSNYPKLVKMVEKRKPIATSITDHVQPYCQKMQVLWDWNIVPIASVPTIAIEEVQYTLPTSTSTSTSTRNHRLQRYRDKRDPVSDLESYCICEWTSQ